MVELLRRLNSRRLGSGALRTLAAANDDALAGAIMPETLFPADVPLADRTATPTLDDHALPRLFPTEGRTAFGTWVKAGALKPGDRVSTRTSP